MLTMITTYLSVWFKCHVAKDDLQYLEIW